MSRRKGFRADGGQGLVEYAVVLPVLFLLILGIMEFAVVLFSYESLTNAAREGARAGILPYATGEQRQTAALSAAIGRAEPLTLTEENFVMPMWNPVAKIMRVEIVYDVHLMTATIIRAVGGNPVISLHTSATMRSE